MMAVFCDESHDDHTYALGGWAITPTHYGIMGQHWREMLETIKMPDGSPCPAFHASAIMNNQKGLFKGWGRTEAEAAFDKATEVVERNRQFLMFPIGVAVEIPASFRDVQRDSIWLMLFTRFFEMVASCGPAARSVEFVFDDKPEIVNYAQTVHKTITGAIKNSHADMFLDGLSFVPDEKSPPVQAADLLMYEWRKRISDVHLRPDRPERPWFPRMRAARPDGQLWRYGRSVFEEALRDQDQSATWARAVMRGDPTDRD